MRTLFSDDIPDPRDIVIISLASACGVFESILSPDELAQVRERIDLVCRLDLIGREVAAAIRQVETVPPLAPTSVRPAAEIPQAAGLPLLGNVFGMAGDLRGFLLGEYRKHGPIFRVRALHYRWVALVGPEANVFAAQNSATLFRSWEQYHEFGSALGAHRVLLSMDGPEHIRMRRLLVNGYSPKMLESHLDLAHDVTLRAIEEWPQGWPIEIQRAMQQIITEQIGMFCSGLSSEEYFDDLVYFLAMMIQMNITKRLPKVMERLPKYRRSGRRMEELYERIMESHRPEKREGQPPDFVDVLLEANQADPQFLPETDLFANVLAPYLVGMDTSASVCAFMLYALLKHPDIMERVREEVDEIYQHGPQLRRACASWTLLTGWPWKPCGCIRSSRLLRALCPTPSNLRATGSPLAQRSCWAPRWAIICRSTSLSPTASTLSVTRPDGRSTSSPVPSPPSASAGTAALAAACRDCRLCSPWRPSSARLTWSWNGRNAR